MFFHPPPPVTSTQPGSAGSEFPFLHSFGGAGNGPLQFDFAGGGARPCFTPWGSNTLVVPEYGNDRLQVRTGVRLGKRACEALVEALRGGARVTHGRCSCSSPRPMESALARVPSLALAECELFLFCVLRHCGATSHVASSHIKGGYFRHMRRPPAALFSHLRRTNTVYATHAVLRLMRRAGGGRHQQGVRQDVVPRGAAWTPRGGSLPGAAGHHRVTGAHRAALHLRLRREWIALVAGEGRGCLRQLLPGGGGLARGGLGVLTGSHPHVVEAC